MLKWTGVILVEQDPACVETLFSDACAGRESVVGLKQFLPLGAQELT
jgi:hypothetical protein